MPWVRIVAAEEAWEGMVSVRSAGVGVARGADTSPRHGGVGVKSQAAMEEEARQQSVGGEGGEGGEAGSPPSAHVDGRWDVGDGGGRKVDVGNRAEQEGDVTLTKVWYAGKVRDVRISDTPTGAQWYCRIPTKVIPPQGA
jgi:hypothetical protein